MLKSLAILFLLAAVIVGAGCHHSTPTSTITPSLPSPALTTSPTPSCPFESWQFCPSGTWQCECSTSTTKEYDPVKLLNPLLQYKPFADFYSNAIEPLGYTIRYFYNPDLPLDSARTTMDTPNRTATIELGNISPDQDFAFIIAHELATIPTWVNHVHFQFNSQCGEAYQRLGMPLRDMFSTPLRDSMLAQYGFDVEREFYAWRVTPLFSLSCTGDPNDPLAVLENACSYVHLVLYWQDVLGNHGIPAIIDCLYQICLPNSRIVGQNILAIIEQSGYRTSQEASTSYQAIFNKYNLQDCIHVSP
jgi:hypothetical protein